MEELMGPLQDVFEDFRNKWREAQKNSPSVWELWQGFAHAVDWKEPWIIALISYMAVMIILALTTRKHTAIQAVLFGQSAITVYFAERLNKLAAQHWQLFSAQHYFDPRGVFFSTMVSAPLLLVMFIVLINYLISCIQLLVRAKAQEIKYKARMKRQQEQQGGSGGSAVAAPDGKTDKVDKKTQ